MGALDFIPIREAWFVLAGFILGFTCSTLWEWLYYRGKRLNNQPLLTRSTDVVNPPAVDRDQPRTEQTQESGTNTLPPYRSSGIFLETERPTESWAAVRTASANNPRATRQERQATPQRTAVPPSEAAIPAFVQKSNSVTTEVQNSTQATVEPSPAPPAKVAVATTAQTAPPASTPIVWPPPTEDQAAVPLSTPSPDQAAPTIIELSIAPQPGPVAPQPTGVQDEGSSTVIEPAEPATRRLVTPAAYPDDLTLIKGVGDAYKRRLYNAGIYTWRQIAETEVDTLRTITRAKPNADLNNWREQAGILAEKYQRQKAVFQGPLDDFTRISGIGPITGDILYKAGIFTYEQLATASVEQLAQIVPAPTIGSEIDYESWLKEAARLVNNKQRTPRLPI